MNPFSSQKTHMSTKRLLNSFTLVELLFVIAIIVMLAGMLLPALKGARTKAHSIKCASDLKQIGIYEFLYSASYNDSLIPDGRASSANYWYNVLKQSEVANSSIDQILKCPADQDPWYDVLSYGRNFAAVDDVNIIGGIYYPPRSLRYFAQPTATMHFIDMQGDSTAAVNSPAWNGTVLLNPWSYSINVLPYIALRHNRSAQVLYLGGNVSPVKTMPPTDARDIFWGYK